ncbi:hypothetical protein pb186bvf_011196 [Paramecium bursaria]
MRQQNQTQIKIDGECLFSVKDDNDKDYYEYKVTNRLSIENLNKENDVDDLRNNNLFRKLLTVGSNKSSEVCYYFEYKPHTITLSRFIYQLSVKKIKSEQLILDIIYQIVEALQLLHSNGLMGRVFNTQNILINERDNKITLMNFGYGSQILMNQQQIENNDPTIYLMPFIQNNNSNYQSILYDEKLDIWLLGCVLFHLMTHEEFKKSQIQQNIQKNDDSMIKEYNSHSYSTELRNLLRDMLRIQQQKRIDFQELVINKLFDNHPKIEKLRDYYKKFYEKGINDREIIKYKINSSYGPQLEQTQEQRMFQIYVQVEQNSEDTEMFKKLLLNENQNESFKLGLHKLIANLQLQNLIYLMVIENQLKITTIFVLQKLFIYFIRKVITIIQDDQILYAAWKIIYDRFYQKYLSDYQGMDINNYCEKVKLLIEDDGQQTCLKVLNQLSGMFKEQDKINFIKLYQLLIADQIELFNQDDSELRIN